MPAVRNGRRRNTIGVREDSESTSTTGQVVPPPIPCSETNDEATSSETQSLIEAQNLVISDGQFNQIRGNYTSIVLNVNHGTSENTSIIQGSPSGPVQLPVPSNETDHISPPSSQSTHPSHERTSPQTEVNQTPISIYERHLISKGRGFPLWIPNPNQLLPLDYRRTGVRIGDVGIINDSGGFSFLFNICLPRDHPVNLRDLPEDFAPISPPIKDTDIEKYVVFKNGEHLASASIKRSQQSTSISGTGSVFESSASEGAILIMPRGARYKCLGNNIARFKKYAAANVANWYKLVNGTLGREAENGDIRLVVGFDKTTSWGIATFVNQTKQNSCRLKFGPSEGDSATTYMWSENSGVTDVRAGPDSDDIDELRIDSDPPDFRFENQCLFVRTVNITLEDDVWSAMQSTLGSVHVDPLHVRDLSASNRPPSSSPSTCGGSNLSPSPGAQYGTQRATGSIYGLENFVLASDNYPGMFISGPPGRLMTHPSKVLNDMLLAKVPNAEMAITDDDDWSSVITQYDGPYYKLSDVAADILASRKICEVNGVVFLQPKEIPKKTPSPTLSTISVPLPVYDLVIPKSILDTDLYKLSMQQAVLHHFPDIQATYRSTNRNSTALFSRQCIERFQTAVSNFSSLSLTETELQWLKRNCPYLTPTYLAYLSSYRFKPEQANIKYIPVTSDKLRGHIEIEVSGPWAETILWDVPLMACLSESYFQVVVEDWNYNDQDNIAYQKAQTLLEAQCYFSEFGTGCRRSYQAQDIVVKAMLRAAQEVQSTGKFTGTSNVHMAHKYDLTPIGTIAHEWFMGVAALNGYEHANSTALNLWEEIYGDNRSPLIAFTDTFSTECFLREFVVERERACRWTGLRQDSGDPFLFGPRVKAMYESIGIDHESKTLVYSDALTIDKCIAIKRQCNELGFSKVVFGIGTFLTNDFRSLANGEKSKPLNIVIKLSSVNNQPCIKLSDDVTKTTGDKNIVDFVKHIKNL